MSATGGHCPGGRQSAQFFIMNESLFMQYSIFTFQEKFGILCIQGKGNARVTQKKVSVKTKKGLDKIPNL